MHYRLVNKMNNNIPAYINHNKYTLFSEHACNELTRGKIIVVRNREHSQTCKLIVLAYECTLVQCRVLQIVLHTTLKTTIYDCCRGNIAPCRLTAILKPKRDGVNNSLQSTISHGMVLRRGLCATGASRCLRMDGAGIQSCVMLMRHATCYVLFHPTFPVFIFRPIICLF